MIFAGNHLIDSLYLDYSMLLVENIQEQKKFDTTAAFLDNSNFSIW